jgi:hypothetical protein
MEITFKLKDGTDLGAYHFKTGPAIGRCVSINDTIYRVMNIVELVESTPAHWCDDPITPNGYSTVIVNKVDMS